MANVFCDSYDLGLLTMFVNVKTDGKRGGEADEEVVQGSSNTTNGLHQPRRD